MAQTLREKLHWNVTAGEITDADRRYIMVRADVLMGIFCRLDPAARQQALAAFGESVRESGGQSAQAYFDSLDNDAQRLLRIMEDYSAELGWGRWSFKEHDARHWELTVHNSPFAHGFGASDQPVCRAIAGMLAAVGELVAGAPVTVDETTCAAQGHNQCSFHMHTP